MNRSSQRLDSSTRQREVYSVVRAGFQLASSYLARYLLPKSALLTDGTFAKLRTPRQNTRSCSPSQTCARKSSISTLMSLAILRTSVGEISRP